LGQDAKNAKKNCRNEKETEALLSSWRPLRLCGFLFQQPAKNGEAVVVVEQSPPRYLLQIVVMPSPETCTN